MNNEKIEGPSPLFFVSKGISLEYSSMVFISWVVVFLFCLRERSESWDFIMCQRYLYVVPFCFGFGDGGDLERANRGEKINIL